MPPLVSVRDLHVYLGESHVLQGISFDVPDGGVTALLGRNGVGKTTTLRALMGLVDRRGTVELAGEGIQNARTHRIVRRGVGLRPGGPGRLLDVDGRREPAARRAGREPRYDLVYDLFPELRQRAASRRPGRSRAGNSRCSRSAGPS